MAGVIPPIGWPGSCPPPPVPGTQRVIRVGVPGLQGPKGDTGSRGFSMRMCQSLDAGQTAPLDELSPSEGVQVGDQVMNSSGLAFLITEVTESTFTVGEVVGSVGASCIDDEIVSAEKSWSSAKIAARLGEPTNFVETFDGELGGSQAF